MHYKPPSQVGSPGCPGHFSRMPPWIVVPRTNQMASWIIVHIPRGYSWLGSCKKHNACDLWAIYLPNGTLMALDLLPIPGRTCVKQEFHYITPSALFTLSGSACATQCSPLQSPPHVLSHSGYISTWSFVGNSPTTLSGL